MAEGDAAFRAVVSGRVQGVGFRDFVEVKARALGLAGYVRNLDDGSLEVVAEGKREKLDRLIDQLHHGPGVARVESVDIEWRSPSGEFTVFAARYRS